MIDTPLLHKAVEHGSSLANYSFNGVIIFHSLFALLAVVSGVIALWHRKGRLDHKRAGQIFVIGMLVTAISGVLLDVVRLSFFVEQNHTKYPGFSMPTSYPARFSFLYVAFSFLYVFSFSGAGFMQSKSVRGLRLRRFFSSSAYGIFLVVTGLFTVLLIYQYYNPWTGALWMIWTFIGLVIFNLWMRMTHGQSIDRKIRVFQHRTNMLALVSFSVWGAAQSFGVAIIIALNGVNNLEVPYTGNLPGDYAVSFWTFLMGWSFFALGGVVAWQWFSKKQRSAV
ncbi:MAG: hypothetical protein COB04_19325 [Gammaproteobacteria bacterium]|nr:MAG: hypothetical protein COB04_19325 [Gammaproteobacteria bacterium]